MGWENPEIPWRELERRLSGRPVAIGDPPRGDGGDSPAWSRKREAYTPAEPVVRPGAGVPFAELHAHSSFSFLDGASSPEELVEEAVRLGLDGLTLTDHDGVYGLVRFAEAAASHDLPTAFGAELSLDVPIARTQSEAAIASRVGVPDPPGTHLLALARDPDGYARLSRAIGQAHLRGGAKGRPRYDSVEELGAAADGRWLVLTGCRKGAVRRALDRGGEAAAGRALDALVHNFGRDNVAVELTYELDPLADERYEVLAGLAGRFGLPLVATTAAHYHGPPRRPLATALAAVRARSSLDEIDGWLPSWSGQHLRSGEEMAQRFARWPAAVANAARLGREASFPLQLIAPDLPPFPCPDGLTEMQYLRRLTYEGAERWFGGEPHRDKAFEMIEHELEIIEQLNFPGYFLVVWDIARFCRSKGILCQGRGSAANSAVCFALQITAVDPVFYDLMFERFLAPERGEPPDIDIDIESDRREEAIQYVYELHGREHAAQVANVITYRPKSAVRDVARALGYSPGQQDAWSKEIEQGYYWSYTPSHPGAGDLSAPQPTALPDREPPPSLGAPAPDPIPADIPPRVLALAAELQNTPRHLGIHSGGMVMCDRPVIEVCPVEWGRMKDRSVLQWDKDDCADIGLVKFDLLGLGMLSALRYCFDLIAEHHGVAYELATIPKEAPCVYEMLQRADSIGVFQVESRAQMATLPRLKPDCFYDLACEVALIRPGPIQGDSVHPFIRRKNGDEEVTYPHPKLKPALERTRGIPLFQEQLMQIAVGVADFSPAEADTLRRAMGSKRGKDKIEAMRRRLYEGMERNGIRGEVANRIFERISAFASFGFAESHSISFALLVYASSWLKLHYPAAFCAALLNAQPMGFYSSQSLVHDAKRHGIEVRGPSLADSLAAASLEAADGPSQCACLDAPQPAVRLGLGSVRTIGDELAQAIVDERGRGPFASMADLSRRVGLTADQVEALATAGAFDCFGPGRRDALWGAGAAATARPGQLDLVTFDETAPAQLPAMTGPEQLIADMWATGVTPEVYPTALIRPRLDALGIVPAAGLRAIPNRTRVRIGGVVTHRQRPATARGVTFLNLEDETGMVNVIVDEVVWQRYRRVARESGGLVIRGMLENTKDGVINVLAERLERLHLGLRNTSRDFR
ncbi:error-prone DNA polymerase, DnaE-like [Jatrophihabitans endophyticus]|uniref:Error-prone DNA polymerase n=1 Tax=Jatrophihabitans endophyticus TaxID=1206085 RepID=A0A1M5UGJ5_9ACTN|nr:error-prone DNA polymerase [Jatrophihabitans endophyticus]SHH62061.1 error-prone DNA polymerase, DnaE-like [Jatrophihabitans endophyticus]